eukprot:2124548-Pyramimonas_sp.AAC.1
MCIRDSLRPTRHPGQKQRLAKTRCRRWLSGQGPDQRVASQPQDRHHLACGGSTAHEPTIPWPSLPRWRAS